MKIETYLAKFFDVQVTPLEEDDSAVVDGSVQIDIFEKGEDSEPIGWFVKLAGCDTYEYRNVYGKVASGTVYSESTLKNAAKAGAFYK